MGEKANLTFLPRVLSAPYGVNLFILEARPTSVTFVMKILIIFAVLIAATLAEHQTIKVKHFVLENADFGEKSYFNLECTGQIKFVGQFTNAGVLNVKIRSGPVSGPPGESSVSGLFFTDSDFRNQGVLSVWWMPVKNEAFFHVHTETYIHNNGLIFYRVLESDADIGEPLFPCVSLRAKNGIANSGTISVVGSQRIRPLLEVTTALSMGNDAGFINSGSICLRNANWQQSCQLGGNGCIYLGSESNVILTDTHASIGGQVIHVALQPCANGQIGSITVKYMAMMQDSWNQLVFLGLGPHVTLHFEPPMEHYTYVNGAIDFMDASGRRRLTLHVGVDYFPEDFFFDRWRFTYMGLPPLMPVPEHCDCRLVDFEEDLLAPATEAEPDFSAIEDLMGVSLDSF